jgi:hypothetical protein
MEMYQAGRDRILKGTRVDANLYVEMEQKKNSFILL